MYLSTYFFFTGKLDKIFLAQILRGIKQWSRVTYTFRYVQHNKMFSIRPQLLVILVIELFTTLQSVI